MRLLLLRHGPTAWNEQGRIQGRSDPPLSPAGEMRVRSWRLPGWTGTAPWFSSPLRRALATAAVLGHGEAAVDALLIEMAWGAFEGRRLGELRCEGGDALAANERRGLDFVPPGGETPRAVVARLRAFLSASARRRTDAVAVTHKGVIRAALVLSFEWTMLGRPPLRLGRDDGLLLELGADGTVRSATPHPLRPESEPGA